jgi:hypothetical protein
MSELAEFRAARNRFFAEDPGSPLTTEQKRDFAGLLYFPENPALRLEAALQQVEGAPTIEMQTSTGESQSYSRIGRLRFHVEGTDAELTVYEGPAGLFLPFVDSLAGTETYPAGRYLEPEQLPGGRLLVDFNLAYNPYCAYNEHWSCPLTPFENRLTVPIRAGERVFDADH